MGLYCKAQTYPEIRHVQRALGTDGLSLDSMIRLETVVPCDGDELVGARSMKTLGSDKKDALDAQSSLSIHIHISR